MKRRSVLERAGVGLTTGAAMMPLAAQSLPSIKWRLASSFPKSLDTLYGAAESIAKGVAAATDGQFQIRVFAGGEIVPGLQVLDAVQNGTVECGHTASTYYVGKDPTFAFDTALPLGLNARQQNAWMYQSGLALLRDFFKDYNLIPFPAGNTGTQMGGWFRKEVKSNADLKGLRFRIAGWGGEVFARLGVIPQQIAGGEV